MADYNFGDRVRVHRASESFEGVYLPSPENGSFLLKLVSGYNIGFVKKDVLKVELVEKKKEVDNHFEVVSDGKKPTIGLVILGGTIAAKLNPGKGGVDFVESPEDLFRTYPELFQKVNVRVEAPFMKASENMDFKDWQRVARIVGKLLNRKDISGVIVTHGTDALHFTSAALSFFLRDLNKPVVLTYSQRSIDRASSDASLNLECAAMAAIGDVAEVMVVGHATGSDDYCNAIIGTKVKKLHSSRRDAFRAVNTLPIMKLYKDRFEIVTDYNKVESGKVVVDAVFEEKVALLKFYPGQNPDILDYYMDCGYKGIVIEMTGLGHIGTSGARLSWVKKIKETQEKGIVICAAAQTINGRLNPLVYSAGRELVHSGVIFLEDMLSETAFVKLGWVLGHEDWARDREVVCEKMLHNFAKEFNPRLLE